MGRKAHPSASGTPLSIRISDQLKTDLSAAAAELGIAEYEVTRLAMQIGLKHFAAINYDLAEAVMNQSGLVKTSAPKPQAAEEPTPEKSSASTVIPEAIRPTASIVHMPKPSTANRQAEQDLAAESQATGTGPKHRQSTSYGSSLRLRKSKE